MRSKFALVIIFISLLKIIFYSNKDLLFPFGDTDAQDYDSYALGFGDAAVNFWSTILRWLNSLEIYSRNTISYFLFFITLSFFPYIFSKITVVHGMRGSQQINIQAFAVIAFYPTIFIFTFDIYRDVFMWFVFCIAVYMVRKIYVEKNNIIYYFLFVCLSFLEFLLRDYLGFSLIAAMVFTYFYKKFNLKIKTVLLVYFAALIVMQLSGLLLPLFEYRGEDGFSQGDSSLGIGLIDKGSLYFIFFFVISFVAQVFGLFVPNFLAVIFFFMESLPFILALNYIIKNIKYSDNLCIYLISFFIIYTSIWVMGNDNLGTALRLRVPSYLSIFACFFILRSRKSQNLSAVHCRGVLER